MLAWMICFLPDISTNLQVSSSTLADTICNLNPNSGSVDRKNRQFYIRIAEPYGLGNYYSCSFMHELPFPLAFSRKRFVVKYIGAKSFLNKVPVVGFVEGGLNGLDLLLENIEAGHPLLQLLS